MNFLAMHVMNIFGEFQVLVADIRAMQALSEPLTFCFFLQAKCIHIESEWVLCEILLYNILGLSGVSCLLVASL